MKRVFTCIFCLLLATPAQAQFNAFKDPATGGKSSGAISGPNLKATVDKFDGNKVTVGGTTSVVGTFTNNGTGPVTLKGVSLYPSSNVKAEVNSNKCAEAPLSPDAVCPIIFTVTGVQTGPWRVEVLLEHDGKTQLATVPLIGDVEAGAGQKSDQSGSEIEASPAAVDFSGAKGGLPLIRAVLLRNLLSTTVTLTSINLDAPGNSGFSFKSECPGTLAPGETCVVNLTWIPVAKGAAQGVLRINHSGKSGVTKIDIQGDFSPETASSAALYPDRASDKGLLVSSLETIDFGSSVSNIAAVSASLVNSGAADLTINSIALAGSDNGISVARNGCRAGLTLKPIEACILTVNWVPSRAGEVVDDLQILHTGARGVLILPIRGTATTAVTRSSVSLRQAESAAPAPAANLPPSLTEGGVEEDFLPPALREKADPRESAVPGITPVLDGYTVTSHSPARAVISGPIGSLMVRDGEEVIISGVRWMVTIVETGVMLSSAGDEFLLVFDTALRPSGQEDGAQSDSSSSSTTTSSTSATTSSSTGTSTNP